MMGVGMNGMAGSPAQGNFMQQVSPISENYLHTLVIHILFM